MNTRPDERLPYCELARQGARVQRRLPAGSLERLEALAPAAGEASADMRFSLDGRGRPWVRGEVGVTVRATCQRCLESFDHALRADFELCIVSDAAQASELADTMDVLVADTEAVAVAEIVEDELILGLPEQLCTEEPCPYRPALEFPATEAAPEEPEDNPFQVLEVLKK